MGCKAEKEEQVITPSENEQMIKLRIQKEEQKLKILILEQSNEIEKLKKEALAQSETNQNCAFQVEDALTSQFERVQIHEPQPRPDQKEQMHDQTFDCSICMQNAIHDGNCPKICSGCGTIYCHTCAEDPGIKASCAVCRIDGSKIIADHKIKKMCEMITFVPQNAQQVQQKDESLQQVADMKIRLNKLENAAKAAKVLTENERLAILKSAQQQYQKEAAQQAENKRLKDLLAAQQAENQRQKIASQQALIKKLEDQIPATNSKDLPDGEYKLRNAKFGGPLFCGDGTDGGGDHRLWVEPNPNYENQGKERWTIKKQQDGTYKLWDCKYKGILFCGDGKDRGGDHWGWVEQNPYYENRGKERWRIEPQFDGTYKLFNVKWKGPLFCGAGKDSYGDHWAWIEKNPNYENCGKERWLFERIN